MTDDSLATQGAKSSAAMVLKSDDPCLSQRNISTTSANPVLRNDYDENANMMWSFYKMIQPVMSWWKEN